MLFLYSEGDMPVCLRKNRPRGLIGEICFTTISWMLREESLSSAFISSMIYSSIQSFADFPLTAFIIVVRYLGVIHSSLA